MQGKKVNAFLQARVCRFAYSRSGTRSHSFPIARYFRCIGMQPVVGNNRSNQSQGGMPPDLVFSEVLALS